jgi:serine/threonine protein kinase
MSKSMGPKLDHWPSLAAAAELEAWVAAFERAAIADGRRLSTSYLPPAKHPAWSEIVTELVRVDLELARGRGEQATLEDYRTLVPDLFADARAVAAAAFEEFRLRRDAGESLASHTLGQKYGLPQSAWPAVSSDEDLLAADAFPAVGDSFGGLRLVSVLGAGAASRVFLARQPEFGDRLVALKITAERTLEPENLGRLQHTNIVPIYSAHRAGGWLGLCMPFCGAVTLADVLRNPQHDAETRPTAPSTTEALFAATLRRGTPAGKTDGGSTPDADERLGTSGLAWRLAADWGRQLAEGLAHAHERDVVHCDVKPANILLGDDGIPRLLDFHLARYVAAEHRQTLVAGGTLPYMGPEHVRAVLEGTALTPASDLFSLGAVLFELLAGRVPYPVRSGPLEEIAAQLVDDRRHVPSLRAIVPEIPAGLEAIVRKCLASQPTDRYASAGALAEDLRRELADLPLLAAPEPSLTARLVKWRRRRRRSLARAGFAAVVMGGIAAAALLLRVQRQAEQVTAHLAGERFVTAVAAARPYLCIPDADGALLARGRELARAALAEFAIGQDPAWRTRPPYAALDEQQQGAVDQAAEELVALLALVGRRLAVDEDAPAELARRAEPLAATTAHECVEAARLMSAHRYAAALALLREAHRTHDGDPVLWIQTGVAQLAVGSAEEAHASLTAAIALQPRSVVARQYRAYAALDAGRPAAALADLEEAERLAPGDAFNQLNRALALLALGRLEEAERAASAALDQGATRPRAWLVRARIRAARGEAAGAAADRREAALHAPQDDHDWAALAVASEPTDPQRALDTVEEGLRAHPQSLLLCRNRAHLLGDVLDRPHDALAAIERLLELRPDDVPAQLSQAVLWARMGKFSPALAVAQRLGGRRLRPLERLQLACIHAQCSRGSASEADVALRQVQAALAAEPCLVRLARRDPDLQTLQGLPAFEQLAAAAEALASTPAASRTVAQETRE